MSERIYVKSAEIVEAEGLSKLYERLRLEAVVNETFSTNNVMFARCTVMSMGRHVSGGLCLPDQRMQSRMGRMCHI